MSQIIENVDDLRRLLKQLGVKVQNVAELQELLATINASYNPDAARVRAVKLTCLTIPSVSFGVAGFASIMCLASTSNNNAAFAEGRFLVGALAIVWGCACLATVVATVLGFLTLLRRHSSTVASHENMPLSAIDRPLTESSSRFTIPRE